MPLQSAVFEVTVTGTHTVLIPDEYAVAFAKAGSKNQETGYKRVAVKAFYKERVLEFHGALHRYQGQYVISFGKRYQKELGVIPSDYFKLQLLEDQSKYGVVVPEALKAVMDSDPAGLEIFETLTPGRKRGLIYYIARFKTEQTQIDKSLLIFENLKRGIREPKEIIRPQ